MSENEPIKSDIAHLFAEGVDLLFDTRTIAAEAFAVRKESIAHWYRGSRPIPPGIWDTWRDILTERIADLQELEAASRDREERVAELHKPQAEILQDNMHFQRLRAEAAEAELAALKEQMAKSGRPVLSLNRVA